MEYEKTGKLIQDLRKEKGMTQMALSQKLGVTDRAVSKWERGKSFPDVSILKPLAETLDVSVSELLDGERRIPDQGNRLPDGAVVLTIEDADKAVMTGIQTYIHETQKRDLIWIGIFLIALLTLVSIAAWVVHERHSPVEFQVGNLEFERIRVVMEDQRVKWIGLDDPRGAELKRQIQKILREEMPQAEEMGRLEVLPRESAQGPAVKLEGLVSLYSGVYYDQRSWEYYTFPDINQIHQKIYSMCCDWLEAGDDEV